MQARGRRLSFHFWLTLFLCAGLAVCAGCSRNRTDLLETELRTREMLYRDAMEDQRHSEARIDALQRELDTLRKGSHLPPEIAAQTFSLRRIVLGRLTGGVDVDNLPGDEALQVIVEPRDESDHTIKAPGAMQVFALEINSAGVKTPLCFWEIPPEKLRESWKQGLLSTGYLVTLPWKVFPQHESVRVTVRFFTPDQRMFEVDKDIKVRLVPGAVQKRLDQRLDQPHELIPPPVQKRLDQPHEVVPPPVPLPGAEKGLIPTTGPGAAWPEPSPTVRHVTPWQPVLQPRVFSIGRPEPIDAPPGR
jgi:hypothetical protein